MSDVDPLYTAIAALPKIDLHRHLEGSLRLSTLLDVAREFDLAVPHDINSLRAAAQVTAQSPNTVEHFLSKFDFLRQFYCSPEVVRRVVQEAIEDAAADNIRYMELRFTPKALARQRSFPFADVIEWVTATTLAAQQQYGIRVKLIASVNRHEPVAEAADILQAVLPYRDRGIVAFDLAGQEAGFTNAPFYDVFSTAKECGLFVAIHAGEWAGAANVHEAITVMGTSRIGHGVRVIEDQSVVELAQKAGTVFEVCLTSNVQSGVVPSLSAHPIRQMVAAGLNTTICTDDPGVSNITLTDELYRAVTELSFTFEEIKAGILTAASSAYLPTTERVDLVAEYTRLLAIESEP